MQYKLQEFVDLRNCLDIELSNQGNPFFVSKKYMLSRNQGNLRAYDNKLVAFIELLDEIIRSNRESDCGYCVETYDNAENSNEDGTTTVIYRTITRIKNIGNKVKYRQCDAPDATYSTIYSYDFSSAGFGGTITLVWYLNGVPGDVHTVTSVTDIVTWLEDYISKTAYDMVVAEDGTTVTITTNESTSVVGNLCLRNTALPPVTTCFAPMVYGTVCTYIYKDIIVDGNCAIGICTIKELYSEIKNYINSLNCINC